ncbi:hypothetical protein SKAU_G00194470 [Synaphobranchus kaupii]|uniref:Uncharacterized protein n=1 Tax=Synaphobranchus kaupii TaxID=118154 RepID=A0A9Q1FEM6_SYNKA|nr:hypothetical protein SKAU_G00194470 [Synaphobranchus kaupii]
MRLPRRLPIGALIQGALAPAVAAVLQVFGLAPSLGHSSETSPSTGNSASGRSSKTAASTPAAGSSASGRSSETAASAPRGSISLFLTLAQIASFSIAAFKWCRKIRVGKSFF